MNDKEKNKPKISRSRIFAFVFIVSVILLVVVFTVIGVKKSVEKDNKYQEVIDLINSEKYLSALTELTHFDEDFKDVKNLKTFCFWMGYNNGDPEDLYPVKDLTFYFLDDETEYNISSKIEAARPAYNEYLEKLKLEQEAYQKEYEQNEAERKKVPWVGMPESDIANTTLGYPSSKVRHNTEKLDNKYITTNIYDFYDSEGHFIFSARCGNGKVINIWDYRDDSSMWSWDPNYHGKSRFDYIDDVKDYADPDDFYYDHYDDFYDYEEAENFYYSHGGR